MLLIISIISTCFGQQFRLSSGALDCVYSLWYKAPKMLPAGGQDEVELVMNRNCHFNFCVNSLQEILLGEMLLPLHRSPN